MTLVFTQFNELVALKLADGEFVLASTVTVATAEQPFDRVTVTEYGPATLTLTVVALIGVLSPVPAIVYVNDPTSLEVAVNVTLVCEQVNVPDETKVTDGTLWSAATTTVVDDEQPFALATMAVYVPAWLTTTVLVFTGLIRLPPLSV